MEWDIHPKSKRKVGERLALLARGHIYGEEILCDPPQFQKAERTEGGIVIFFEHGEGLHLEGEQIQALELYDQTGNRVAYESVAITENKIYLEGKFTERVTIRFARTLYYEVNLYNRVHNPAKPFETVV